MPKETVVPRDILYPPEGGETFLEREARVDQIMVLKRDHTPPGETEENRVKRINTNKERRRYYTKKDTKEYKATKIKSSKVCT